MSDRRRRVRNRRSTRNSRWLIATQLLVMAGVLVFIFVFRDYLAASASNIFSAFDEGDLEVTADASQQPTSGNRPGRSTPKLKVIDPTDTGVSSSPDGGDVTSRETSRADTRQ